MKEKIHMYINCKKCLDELPENESPESYKRLDVGHTDKGIAIICIRHNCLVTHFEYVGKKNMPKCSCCKG